MGVGVEKKAWEKLLNADVSVGDAGLTTGELAEKHGVSINTIQRRMRRLLSEGLVKQGVGMRKNSIGVWKPTPVYEIVENKND